MGPRPVSPSRCSLLLVTALVLGSAACTDPTPVATKLAFTTQPGSTIGGSAISPSVQVEVQDADGNRVTTANNPITVAIGSNGGGGALSGTTTVPALNGVATFADLRINSAGTGYTLAASSPNLAGATSAPFAVVAGQAAKLAFIVQPGLVTSGAAIAPAVRVAVQDAGGNTVTNSNHVIAIYIANGQGGAILSGTTSVAAVNGIATFSNLSLDRAGPGYSLGTSSPSLVGATTSAFVVAPGAASRLVFTLQPSSALPGAVIVPAVVVAIQDLFGNLVTTATHSITVAIGTNPGSGTLSGTTMVAAINGVATFSNLIIDNLGTGYTLTATAVNLIGGTSIAFHIRNPLLLATIAAGYFHSCGLTPGGAGYCWGANFGGQLGAGVGPSSNVAIAVAGGLSFAKLSAGRTHSCGVTAGGVAYCWGDNSLGTGSTSPSPVPLAVAGALSFANVIAGYGHSCGVTTGGAGYCWGFNGNGELGNGSTVQSNVPAAVSGALVFASISPGRSFTCGLTMAGAAYCWGANGDGELGDGTTTSRATPAPVAGALTFAMVGAGGFHSCGLTIAGAAYCWGSNFFGALGSAAGSSSTPRLVSGGLTFAMLSAGNRHTCGVTAAGVAYCWGDNSSGLLGNGTTTASSVPVPVSGGLIFATISAGRFHTCGVTTGGAAYCWGGAGALGDGTDEGRLVPTRVF